MNEDESLQTTTHSFPLLIIFFDAAFWSLFEFADQNVGNVVCLSKEGRRKKNDRTLACEYSHIVLSAVQGHSKKSGSATRDHGYESRLAD